MMLERTDFYDAMGVDYKVIPVGFEVTEEGNLMEILVVSGGVIVATQGTSMAYNFATTGASVVTMNGLQKKPGNYRNDIIIAYGPAYRGLCESIITIQLYYKAPEYDDYAPEPIVIETVYSGLAEEGGI